MGRVTRLALSTASLAVVAAGFGCQAPTTREAASESAERLPDQFRSAQTLTAHGQVTILLSLWHRAAAKGDFEGYFGRMTPSAVFLGTDKTERWSRAEFEAFARPYFDGVHAWTYEQRETNLVVAPGDDPDVVWFDELLFNEKYGDCRGTGVAERGADGRWRIAHYSLTFLVPNEASGEVVDLIRGNG